MSNPACVSDINGEWFEVYNQGDSAIDMNGWILSDNGSDFHIINNNGPLIILPDSFLTFGINSDSNINGNYICDYQYSSFALANNSDEIILRTSQGQTIDSITYGAGTSINSPSTGISSVFISCGNSDNNIGSNWQLSLTRENTYFAICSDLGSPGSKGSQQIISPALKIISPTNSCEGENVSFLSNTNSATQMWYSDSSLSILLGSGNFYQTSALASGIFEVWLVDSSICNSIPTQSSVTVFGNSFSTSQVNACDFYIWPVNNQTYSSSGSFTDTLTNANGCDSIVNMDLTITNSNTGSETITACDSYTWPANGQTYTTSGTQTVTLTNASGCDSVVTLNLTINQSNTGTETITACDTYTWPANGQTYTASGTQTATLTNAAGCDSVVTLNLTINQSNTGSETVMACDSYTWPASGQTYTNSGTHTVTLNNASGCDSVVTLNLTINTSNTGSETTTTCDTYTWPANNQTYTSSGSYTTTLSNASGCDSVVTLNLTINNSNSGSETISACDSYTWPANGQTYTSSGTQTATLTNASGCDSVITLNLTINQSNTGSETITACDTYTWPANGQTYTSSGTHTATLSNAAGCDSVVTLNLTINQSNSGSETITACDTYTWPANGQTYTASGTQSTTLTNAAGCDSVVTLNLTINQSNTGSETITACDTYTWPANGQTYTVSGTQTATLTNAAGCDSVVTLNLTINNSNTGSQTITACDSYTWPANGQTYTVSGTQIATLTNASGCDSVVTLNLTINQSNTGSETVTACDSYIWPANGQTYTSSGTQTTTLTNAAGCDSVVTLNLSINQSNTGSETITACDTYTWPANGQTYTVSGTQTVTLTNAAGCDSVVTLNLTINNSVSSSAGADICNGDTYIFGSQTLTSAGTYTEVFQTSQGCDSTVNLTLNVITVDTSVTVSSNTLTANSAGASYQWLDCDNGNAAISGETNQSFTATQTGNYAVVVTENGCSDTSACFNIVIIGLRNGISSNIILYPNPTLDRLFVDYPDNLKIQRVRIVSLTGAEMILTDPSELKEGVNTKSLKAGVYHLVFEGADFRQELKFVKE